MRYGAWTIGFYTEGHRPLRDDFFGCATQGMTCGRRIVQSDGGHVALWRTNVMGWAASGTYDAVLSELAGASLPCALALVFFTQGRGQEAFLSAFRSLYPQAVIAGGGAATSHGGSDGVSPEGADAAVLLVESGLWRAEAENVLPWTGVQYAFEREGARHLARLRREDGVWESAQPCLAAEKRARRVAEWDNESLTLSDEAGRNLHFHEAAGALIAGRDLPSEGPLLLRHAERGAAETAVIRFAQREGALILGCAGLKTLLSAPYVLPEDALAVYLHGEIAGGAFCNLMMTSLEAM